MILPMGRGGYREGAGRKTIFPNKVLDRRFGMDFTPAGRAVLDALQARTGLSQNDILGHLVQRHATRLAFTEPGVVFRGKAASNVISIRLPADLADALTAAQARTGKSFSDLGEALVRWYGHKETFPVLPGKEPARRRPRRQPARRRRRA